MKFVQLVVGPAGCGKSTYCSIMQQHCEAIKRTCHVVNLDPAAESFSYNCSIDVRELISVDEAMDELNLGPNGGLVFAMEYLIENLSWLEDQFDTFGDDDYILIDCPGQIELYTHIPVMKEVVDALAAWDCRVCGVYCIDVSFITDATKFIAGAISALSTMIQMEIPHTNVLTKADLIEDPLDLERILEAEPSQLASELRKAMNPKYRQLNIALSGLLEEYNYVSFVPLNPDDESSIAAVLYMVDNSIQYGENQESKADFDMNSNPND